MSAPIAYIDLAQLMYSAGFAAGEDTANGLATCTCESGRIPDIDSPIHPDGSVDRGLWQINSKAHPEVTDACAHDPTGVCSTAAAFKISNGGTDWSPWTCFSQGLYKTHLEAARVALDGAARVRAANAKIAALQAQLAACQQTNTTLQTELAVANAKIAAAVRDLS